VFESSDLLTTHREAFHGRRKRKRASESREDLQHDHHDGDGEMVSSSFSETDEGYFGLRSETIEPPDGPKRARLDTALNNNLPKLAAPKPPPAKAPPPALPHVLGVKSEPFDSVRSSIALSEASENNEKRAKSSEFERLKTLFIKAGISSDLQEQFVGLGIVTIALLNTLEDTDWTSLKLDPRRIKVLKQFAEREYDIS
jgi:hypothetical protein